MDFSKLSATQKQYALAIADKAREMGVDPELAIAVAFRESSFDPKALGPKLKDGRQAIGLMQIDPTNAKGLKMTIEDLQDPEKNIAAGIQILRENLDRYKGNTRAALVAYNARPEIAKKYLASNEDFSVLPLETRKYLEDIDAIHNTDAVGYANKGDLRPAGGAVAGPSRFGDLPPPEEGQQPITDITESQTSTSKFGDVDPNNAMQQAEDAANAPPPEPTFYESANKMATDVYKAAKNNPELSGAVASSGAAGVLLGMYGKNTLDKQTANLDQAKTDLRKAYAGQQVDDSTASRLSRESSQSLGLAEDDFRQRQQNLAMREEELRKIQADLAEKKPTDFKGAQKYTDTLGGDDVPFEQKRLAENMRGDNQKGGQNIINSNSAAKAKLREMGLTDYSLTEPSRGQLAVPNNIAAERQAKLLAEQQAQNKANLEAERRLEIARQEASEAQRVRDTAAKRNQQKIDSATDTAAQGRGNVEKSQINLQDMSKKAPTGLGKAGVFAGKVAGKTIGALSGIAVPLAMDEAAKRQASGDTMGAVISGAEAVLAVMAMLPPGTPITAGLKAVGIGGGLAVAVIDYLRNRSAKPASPTPKPAPKPPSGALSQYQERKPNGIYKDAYGRYNG